MVAVIPKALTCVSALDKRRLESLIERTFAGEGALSSSASRVLRRLRTADLVVQPDDVPRDLVTMNSTVRLVDPISCDQWEVTLVYPEEHDPGQNSWSVLSPVGSAVFGLRIYEAAEVKREDLPTSSWIVADIPFQPETRGWLTM
jgi:regulator of nucleoside diphosphate kinase